MIIQGTTPTHSFQLPFDVATVKTARFVYSQDGAVVCVKKGAEVNITPEGVVSTTLTQEDTYSFTPGTRVKLVLRVLTVAGEAPTTEPVYLLCRGQEDKEVMK